MLGDLPHQGDRLRHRRPGSLRVRALELAAPSQEGEEEQEATFAVRLSAQLVPQRRIDQRFQRRAHAVPVRDGAVVREEPRPALEGMCVFLRHAANAGLADVGNDRLRTYKLRQLLEIGVAVGRSETADHTRHSVFVPADAPTIGMLTALHAECVCAVKELMGYGVDGA